MTEFVLEILDGDRAGEVFELGDEPLTFGRRPGNTVVLKDEKCSGRHASVVREDNQWVLKDLDSTNGTLLDGRRVDEVGLTANDIFQLGLTRVAFKEKGAPTPATADLTVKRVDQAMLARTRRGGGIGVMLGLVVILGGAAVWYFYFRGGEAGPVSRQAKAPLQVIGNLLAGGDFEGDDVFETVAGTGFVRDASRKGAHTGSGYMLAVQAEDDNAPRFGLSRSLADITVSAGSGVSLRAFVRTTGAAKAAVRARFSSSVEEQSQVLFTGIPPAGFAEYTEVALDVGVPEGCDRVRLELLAILPDRESTVSVDDVSLVAGDVASADKGTAPQIQTSAGQRVVGCGGALWIDDTQQPILLGLRPVVKDPILAELAKRDLLGLSDVGLGLVVANVSGGVDLQIRRGAGVAKTDLMLRFASDVAASGVLSRTGDAPFANQGSKFDLAGVDTLLLGYKTARLMIQLPQPDAASAAVSGRAFEMILPGSSKLRLVYDFGAQRDAARQLLGDASRLESERKYDQVLDKLQVVLDQYPHDDSMAAQAVGFRTRVLDGLRAEVERLHGEMDEATYFDSLRGYRRIRDQLTALVTTYGERHLLQPEKIAAMQKRVDANIDKIEQEEGKAARAKLDVLAEVYGGAEKAEDKALADLIRQYLEKQLPSSKSETPGRSPEPKEQK